MSLWSGPVPVGPVLVGPVLVGLVPVGLVPVGLVPVGPVPVGPVPVGRGQILPPSENLENEAPETGDKKVSSQKQHVFR